MNAPVPANEAARLAALHEYRVLDTGAEACYDDITRLAAHVCGTPIAVVSLVDADRQWFKSRVGVDATESPREVAFCAHAILGRGPLVVEDATNDERFAQNPFVAGDPRIRFYAGAPLVTSDGCGLGTLCVVDMIPRRPTPAQLDALAVLSRQVVTLLEHRRVAAQLADALERVKVLGGLLPMCAWCRDVRNDAGYWQRVEAYLHEHAGIASTHSICPACYDEMAP